MKGVLEMAKNNVSLDKEMMKNIDSYSNKIKTLEDFVEAVRTRPGMYIGPVGNGGFLNMIREICQNSFDQLVDKNSPCNYISIYYNEKDLRVRVEDNGLGIPFNDMERIFTTQHTSKNFEKKQGDYSSGLNGVGAKVTNALSSYFRVYSYHYSGTAKMMEMKDGHIVVKPKDVPNKEKRQGSVVEFIPSLEVLGDIDLSYKAVYKLIKLILSLTDIGSVVYFEAVDKKGKEYKEKMVNEDGIITDLIMKTTKPIINPIIIHADTGFMKTDIAMTWASPSEKLLDAQGFTAPYSITTFSNWCPTRNEGSTHFAGFVDGLSSWFTKYMNKIYLSEKSKVKVTKNDCLEQLCAMVSCAHLNPNFIGQSKDILSNEDMKPFMKESVINGLDEWAKNNPADLQRVCKWIKEAASARMKSEESKSKVVETFKKSSVTGLPEKFKEPLGNINRDYNKYDFELLIVEGDSAGGQVGKARDKMLQGVFPIRGKILNPFGASIAKIKANVEIQGIANILGAGMFENFDIRKVKYKKIVFVTDADPDGAHIATLLLRVCLIVFPGLIESGRVYKAVPPFFSIRNGKKSQYFIDKVDYVKFKPKAFISKNQITDITGKPIDNKKLLDIFIRFDEYTHHLEKVAHNYAVDPLALESILYNYVMKKKIDASIGAEVKSLNRFVDVSFDKKSETLKVTGLINDKINNLYFNKDLISECDEVINDIEIALAFGFLYKLNGVRCTLYQLMKAFDDLKVSNQLNRFKGLGEMETEDLAQSTVRPSGDRILIQYTTENIDNDFNKIREYESDKSKILKLVGKLKRSDIEK